MYILGVDTTQAACSAALYDALRQRVCASNWHEMPRGHAEALPGIINTTLKQAGLAFNDIGKLATTIGPGTFSGVRIGLAAARGFALALDLPLVGITSLEAIAAGVENYQQKTVLAAFDARRDEVYGQIFTKGQPATSPQLLSVREAASLADHIDGEVEIVGTASEMLAELNNKLRLSHAPALPDSAIVAKLASERSAQDAVQGAVQPLYLRKADAKAQTPLLHIEPGKLSLSQATAAHSEILAEIHAQGFSNPWSAQSIADSLATPGSGAMLALAGNEKDAKDTRQNTQQDIGEPLGFVIFRDVAGEREILTLAVRLDARRRKVARFLLDAMTRNAIDNRISKVFLEVSENNFAAQGLYKKRGFIACGCRKNYYTENDGQKYDAIIMQHNL